MMNINDGDVNLGLATGSTNYSIRTRLSNSSGAGVNANSRMDPAFPASDPLSELVWSPHNGLSLKCANSSAADKKPFLLWNVGPSNKGPSPSQVIRPKGSQGDNVVDQGNTTMPQTMLDADDIFVDKATLLKPLESRGSNRKAEEEAEAKDALQEEGNCINDGKEDFYHPQNVQSAGITEISKQNADLQPQKERDDEVTSATGAVNENKINMLISIPAPPSKKPECAAENDLYNLTEKDACSLGGKRTRDKSPPVEGFPTNSRFCLYEEKGKEKALSDGDIYGRSSDDKDDSHESVESCDSAGFLSRCIKRESCGKGVIHGSKRIKNEIPESCGSTSITRADSSFMNWISNMVKGLSDSNKEDSSSLVLTLTCSNDVYGKNHHENFMCNKTHDSASLNMGFQTIFKSLYYRDTNILETRVQKENDSIEESREVMVDDKKSLEKLPGDTNYGSSCKQIIICDREANPIGVGQPSKPCILSADIDCSPYPCESNLDENKASVGMVSNRAKDAVIPPDSLGEQMNRAAEETSPDIQLAMSDAPGKSNLNSLWITRLCTKNPRSKKCQEHIQETTECFTSCPKVDLDCQINAVFPIDQKSSETRDDSTDSQVYAPMKEGQKFTTNTESSVDLKSKSKLCPILPSQKFRSSETMASVFARRLDALRHIIPSEKKISSTFSLTCFFCGGCHDLRECPNVTKSELQDLLAKMSSLEKAEESSCLCIRCSQLDHWAISCPLAPSSRHWISEQKASVVSQYTAWNVQMSSSKRVSNSNETQRAIVSNFANDVKGNQKLPLCDIVSAQNTVALSEIFHAIRNLRLSRADILRWMNSNVSLSHLNGFFLRLRLGKLEAGLEGTSYYVACITGDARDLNGCALKKSILVDVGGIKSSVPSQYVSNHDFLEDEIKAWWCRIVDGGCRVPSLDELNSKLNDRKSLGF